MNYEQVLERKDARQVIDKMLEHLRNLKWVIRAGGIGYDVTPPGGLCSQWTEKSLFNAAVLYGGFAVEAAA